MTSPTKHHVAVWLDHEEARVFRIEGASFDETTLRAPQHHVKRHPDHNTAEKHHPDDAKRFFGAISDALGPAEEILVVGPSTAKLHFVKYVQEHDPKLARRIVGLETVDHPTDNQLVAHARAYFENLDGGAQKLHLRAGS